MASMDSVGLRLRPTRLVAKARRSANEFARWMLTATNNFDPSQNLYVFSDPRGGSTWLTEAISLVPKTAVLWEPLHIKRVQAWDRIGFGWRQHIPEDVAWEEARALFERVFRGKLLNDWTLGSSYWEFAQAERLIIKTCRGNALLPWLTRQFDFANAPVFFIRHPFAVVASQLAHGAWNYEFGGYDVAKFKPGSVWDEHKDFLATVTTQEARLVVRWCTTTLQTLRHPRNDKDWITVRYEDVLVNPLSGIEEIFGKWGLPVPKQVMTQLQTPSSTTKQATFKNSTAAQLIKWKKQLSDEQLQRMIAVFEAFGVTEYGVEPRRR